MSFHRNSFFIALVIFICSAWMGTGFFHADEHYQIIEFANSKLHTYSSNEYAWEFEAASRSALQPFMAFLIFKFLSWFSVTDPYLMAFVLRLITALVTLMLIRKFIFLSVDKLNFNLRKPFILLSYFLWIIPFVSVRFSSEVWAGIALLATLVFLMKDEKVSVKTAFLAGIAIGFSFLFRFQMGAVVFGIFAWLIFIAKPGLRSVFAYLSGFLIVFLLGILIDYWFYGKLVLSSWNYFDLQILQSVAAGFGETPWYEYFSIIIFAPGWPIGLLILISLIWFLIRNPRHILSWIVLSFLLLHILVGHKEERFLFPLVNFVPFILISLFQEILKVNIEFTISQKRKRLIAIVILLPFVAINMLGLAITLSKSAGSGGVSVAKFIRENYADAPVKLIHTAYSSPFSPFDSAPLKFYAERNIASQKIDRLCHLNDSILESDSTVLFSMRRIEHSDPECESILQKSGLKKIHISIPAWILKVDKYVDVIKEDDVIELYRNILLHETGDR